MIEELLIIYTNIVLPSLAAIAFLALAKFVRHITPLRAFVSSMETYVSAFWGLLFFGIYLALRPVQVLAGPHPWPLFISCLREFILIAVATPFTFIALMTLSLGAEKFTKRWMFLTFLVGAILGTIFCIVNFYVIQGSQEIVKLGMLTAYDGLWNVHDTKNMSILFYIHLLNPGLLLLIGATAILLHAKNYPLEIRELYDNMPKKLLILSTSVYAYAIPLILGSFYYGHQSNPDHWVIYPLGTLLAGILETISLSMPVRNDVQVSEHG